MQKQSLSAMFFEYKEQMSGLRYQDSSFAYPKMTSERLHINGLS